MFVCESVRRDCWLDFFPRGSIGQVAMLTHTEGLHEFALCSPPDKISYRALGQSCSRCSLPGPNRASFGLCRCG
jgi:hypothetical protein